MKDYERAKKRYNKIMQVIGCDHLTIGLSLSEGTEGWNIRDMVSEAQYNLDRYNDPDSMAYEMKLCGEEGRKQWRSEKGKLERFIQAYEEIAMTMNCKERHCSKYD